MIYLLYQKWSLPAKISISLSLVCANIAIGIFFFIYPPYQKLIHLKAEQKTLEQQWQQLQLQSLDFYRSKKELELFNQHYGVYLKLFVQKNLSVILTQISTLVNSQHLQLITLKPQKHDIVSGLNKEEIELEVRGSENQLFFLIYLLMNQSWLMNMKEFHFSGQQLKCMVEIYYAS